MPYFIAAATRAVGGSLTPVPGGVLVQDEQKCTIGAVYVTGDTSDNDEATAFATLAAANLIERDRWDRAINRRLTNCRTRCHTASRIGVNHA